MSPASYILIILVGLFLPIRAWFQRKRLNKPTALYLLAEQCFLLCLLLFVLRVEQIQMEEVGFVELSVLSVLLQTIIMSGIIIGIDIIGWQFLRRTIVRQIYSNSHFSLTLTGKLYQQIPQGKELILFTPLCVIGAIWEEIYFRGLGLYILQNQLDSLFLAVLVSSLVFSLNHLGRGYGSALYAGFYGILFSIFYLSTGVLLPVIIAHSIGNLFVALYIAPKIKSVLEPTPIFL